MAFQPKAGHKLVIDDVTYSVAEHPAAASTPYAQEGRQSVVYQLATPSSGAAQAERRALKVFKPRYRIPALVSMAGQLASCASLPGLQVCRRTVLSPHRHAALLRQYPDLTYAVLMPWVNGPTWAQVMLEKREFTPQQSLTLARSLADVLARLEQENLAHCDLSSSNMLLPVLAGEQGVALVDVEQMYHPGWARPSLLPGGSPGYAHRAAPDGLWSAEADRFAGAILLAEMLAWCDGRVRELAWGESYFDPQEMQQDGVRFQVLRQALRERWGMGAARLFERVWHSETPVDCATLGEWLVVLPETAPAPAAVTTEAMEAVTTEWAEAEEAVTTEWAEAGEAVTTEWAETQEAATAEWVGTKEEARTEKAEGPATIEWPEMEGPLIVDDAVTEAKARKLLDQARQLERQGDIAGALQTWRRAYALAPAKSSLKLVAKRALEEAEKRRAAPRAYAARPAQAAVRPKEQVVATPVKGAPPRVSRTGMLLSFALLFAVVGVALYLLLQASGDIVGSLNTLLWDVTGALGQQVPGNTLLAILIGVLEVWIFRQRIRSAQRWSFVTMAGLGGLLGGLVGGLLVNVFIAALSASSWGLIGAVVGAVTAAVASFGQNRIMQSHGLERTWLLWNVVSWAAIWAVAWMLSWSAAGLSNFAISAALIVVACGAALALFLHRFPGVEF